MSNRLNIAKHKGDAEAESRILAIIQSEKDRSYWRRLTFGTKRGKVEVSGW